MEDEIEVKQADIGIVLTQSESGDEVTLFMKSLNGEPLDVQDVLKIISTIDIKAAMAQMAKNRVTTHPMPKEVM